MPRPFSVFVCAASAMLVPLAFVGPVLAQVDRASVTGHITDPSGASLPGVMVIARDTASGATFSAKTNNAGAYSIEQLPIGDYTINMTHDGFTETQSSVHRAT